MVSNRELLMGGRRPRPGYDVMQVCLNGHQITSLAVGSPDFRRDFCKDCGAKTIMSCEVCSAQIRGRRHDSMSIQAPPVPKYCEDCGGAFPWQQAAIDNLTEILRDDGLDESDMAVFESALPDVIRETPKTESATLKVAKVLKGLGKPAYDVSIKVLSDLASETAKKALGLP